MARSTASAFAEMELSERQKRRMGLVQEVDDLVGGIEKKVRKKKE